MTTLETSKTLAELGFNQSKPLFAYIAYGSGFKGDETPSYANGFEPNQFLWVKCPTLEELLEVMPTNLNGLQYAFHLVIQPQFTVKQYSAYYNKCFGDGEQFKGIVEHPNPSEAVALLLIKLIQEGLVKL